MFALTPHLPWGRCLLPLALGLTSLSGCAVYTSDAHYVHPPATVVRTTKPTTVIAAQPIIAAGTVVTHPGPVWVNAGPVYYGRPPLYTPAGRYPSRWYRPVPYPLPAYRPIY